MKILGLDLAKSTGWAVLDKGQLIASGTQVFEKRRGESNGIMFLKLQKFLRTLIQRYEPQLIAYEQAHFRGAGTEILVGYQTHTQSVAEEAKIESVGIHTGTVKKAFTGKGNASKQEVMEMAELLFGVELTSDDEADAIAVAYAAAKELE